MAAEAKYPVTPAIRALRGAGVSFEQHLYDYEEHGGTKRASAELGVDEHCILKTLVMQNEAKNPLIIVMHGDREVATGLLAKAIGAKSVTPCDPKIAEKHTGYQVGGISPFGTRTADIPVYAEKTIFDLPKVYINGGKRGFLVSLSPEVLKTVRQAQPVEAAVPQS
jgi:Cys-tRNA(Pro) deacylase